MRYTLYAASASAARGSEVGTLTTALRAVEVPMDWIREAATTRQSGSEE